MNKKNFLKSVVAFCSVSPVLSIMACGNQSSTQVDWFSAQAQKLADQTAKAIESVDSTYLAITDFPDADLTNPLLLNGLGLILPPNMPEATLEIPTIVSFVFVINRNTDKNTAELELYSIAGAQAQTGFSAHTFLTLTKFAQKLDLSTFPNYTANQGDTNLNFTNKAQVSDTDLKTALTNITFNALKTQMLNVETTDYTLSDWKTNANQDIPATSNLTTAVNQYKTTIQAQAASQRLSSSKELIITIPELNQLDISTFANFDAQVADFNSLSSKNAAPKDELETILTDIILKKFQVVKPSVTVDDFEIDFEKDGNGGFLDSTTDLTISGGFKVDAHIYSKNRNDNLINQNPDLIISIPQLS